MVLLFSARKSKTEKEMIEILTKYGGSYISDKMISSDKNTFTVISEYKKTDIKLKKGIAVFIDDTDKFNEQVFPKGITGICDDNNAKALEIFKKSDIPVITCGMNPKNTVTLSSLNSETLFATLQRTVTDVYGNGIYPGEFKIKIEKEYSPFAVMASAAVLLLCGIVPESF